MNNFWQANDNDYVDIFKVSSIRVISNPDSTYEVYFDTNNRTVNTHRNFVTIEEARKYISELIESDEDSW